MSIINIVEISCGVLVAKLIIGVINEGYWYKWQRVRVELKRLQRSSKRHKKKIKVPHESAESPERDIPLLPDTGRGEATGKYGVTQKRCAFPRFFNPPN